MFAIPLFRRYLPERVLTKKRFDFLGAVLAICSVILLLFFVTGGNLWSLAGSVITAFWFVFHLRYSDTPFLSPGLFRISAYRNLIIGSFLSVGTVFGMMFMIPIMLRDLNALPADRTGLIMFPGAISAAIFGTLGGKLSDRVGSRFVVYIGAGVLTAGFFLLSKSAGHVPWIIGLNLIICYIGFSFLQSSLPHTISVVVPSDQTGIGMGIYNLVFFISGAFSTAIIGRILDFRVTDSEFKALSNSPAGIYTTVFLVLSAAVLAAVFIFVRSLSGSNRVDQG
jgi:MFS transporter, DHA2 family, metal-tetracycline-proton antiporter